LKLINFSLFLFEGIIKDSEDKEENKEDDGGKYSDVSISIILSLLLSGKENNGIKVEEEEEEEEKLKLLLLLLGKLELSSSKNSINLLLFILLFTSKEELLKLDKKELF
jgi:hypothetical protein